MLAIPANFTFAPALRTFLTSNSARFNGECLLAGVGLRDDTSSMLALTRFADAGSSACLASMKAHIPPRRGFRDHVVDECRLPGDSGSKICGTRSSHQGVDENGVWGRSRSALALVLSSAGVAQSVRARPS